MGTKRITHDRISIVGYVVLIAGSGLPAIVSGIILLGLGMSFGPAITSRFLESFSDSMTITHPLIYEKRLQTIDSGSSTKCMDTYYPYDYDHSQVICTPSCFTRV